MIEYIIMLPLIIIPLALLIVLIIALSDLIKEIRYLLNDTIRLKKKLTLLKK